MSIEQNIYRHRDHARDLAMRLAPTFAPADVQNEVATEDEFLDACAHIAAERRADAEASLRLHAALVTTGQGDDVVEAEGNAIAGAIFAALMLVVGGGIAWCAVRAWVGI